MVSKSLSAPAIIDALSRSEKYKPEFYVVERQLNPFTSAVAKKHIVLPGLELDETVKAVSKFADRVQFGLTDTEDFVIGGGRDRVEKEAGVEMICVAKRFAVERSKIEQRLLFDEIFPRANPRYRAFRRQDARDKDKALARFRRTVAELGEVVIKPDAPARGAGVGVWGSDFAAGREMELFFLDVLSKGGVVVEEKVVGEESSFHAFSDGKHFVPTPLTQDYKRGLEHGRGKLTGGMGSYRDRTDYLPFLQQTEWEHLLSAEEAAFRKWKGRGSQPGLRGIVLYDAIMHTGSGFKVLERNSRGGNTEFMNILTTISDDLVDVCYRILDGDLHSISFAPRSSVVTCGVPLAYGVEGASKSTGMKIDLSMAEEECRKDQWCRLYPMDVHLESDETLMGESRTAAFVGLGETMESARRRSLRLAKASSGPIRWRHDIASAEDVRRSAEHMAEIRLESSA